MPTRYFECKEDGHSKFWEISWPGDKGEYTTRWGPIGSLGTSKKKVFNSLAEAATDLEKIVRSKVTKGYKEKKIVQKEEKKEPVNKKPDYLEIW